MRKTTSAVAVALLMVVSYAAGRRHTRQNATPNPNSRRVPYWVDPMHPDYKSDHPGIAPDCRMPLEPVYAGPGTSLTASEARLPDRAVGSDLGNQQVLRARAAPRQNAPGSGRVR